MCILNMGSLRDLLKSKILKKQIRKSLNIVSLHICPFTELYYTLSFYLILENVTKDASIYDQIVKVVQSQKLQIPWHNQSNV